MQSTKPAPITQLSLPLINHTVTFTFLDERPLVHFVNMAFCNKKFATVVRTIMCKELHRPVFEFLTKDMDPKKKKEKFPLLNQDNPTQQQIMAINRDLYQKLGSEQHIAFLQEQFTKRPYLFRVRYFQQSLFHDAINVDLSLAIKVNEQCTRAARRDAFRYCLDQRDEEGFKSPRPDPISGLDHLSFCYALESKMPTEDVEPIVLDKLINQGRKNAYIVSLDYRILLCYLARVDSRGQMALHLGIKAEKWTSTDLNYFILLCPQDDQVRFETCMLESRWWPDNMRPSNENFKSRFVAYFKSHDDLPLLIKQLNSLMNLYQIGFKNNQTEFLHLLAGFIEIAHYYFAKEFPDAKAPMAEMNLASLTKLRKDFSPKAALINDALYILRNKGERIYGLFSRYDDAQLSISQRMVVNQVIQANGKAPREFLPNSRYWQEQRDWIIQILTTAQTRAYQWVKLCKDFESRMPITIDLEALPEQFKLKSDRVQSLDQRDSPADSKGPKL